LSINAARPQQRRPLKVMPWTEDWRREIIVLVEKGHASSVSEFLLEFGSRQRQAETAEERAENLIDGVPDADQTLEQSGADTPSPAPDKPTREPQHGAVTRSAQDTTGAPPKAYGDTATSEQHPAPTAAPRIETGAEARMEATPKAPDNAPTRERAECKQRPTADAITPHASGTNTAHTDAGGASAVPAAATSQVPDQRRSTRERKPNPRYANLACFLSLGDRTMDEIMEALPRVRGHRSRDTFGCFDTDEEGKLEDACDVTSLESALRTQYRNDAVEATKKELKSLLEHKTWRYLSRIEDRQPSVHRGVEPSACILKDKKDSFGQFLLFKSRFYNVGSHTHDSNYGAFDKTSPTASHDTICLLLALASYHKWLLVRTQCVPEGSIGGRQAPLHADQQDGRTDTIGSGSRSPPLCAIGWDDTRGATAVPIRTTGGR
jgi:hypothetical protein